MSKSNKKPFHSLLTVYFFLLNEMYIKCSNVSLPCCYKSRLVFAYYNILRFYCFKKSIQRVLKTWLVLKPKKKIFWKMSKYRNTVFDDFKSRFLVVFFQQLPAPSSVGNTVSRPYFSQNLEIPYWKSSFPVHQ